jgi:hypothetical protein
MRSYSYAIMIEKREKIEIQSLISINWEEFLASFLYITNKMV